MRRITWKHEVPLGDGAVLRLRCIHIPGSFSILLFPVQGRFKWCFGVWMACRWDGLDKLGFSGWVGCLITLVCGKAIPLFFFANAQAARVCSLIEYDSSSVLSQA